MWGRWYLPITLCKSIICTWFFFEYDFGNYNKRRFHQLYYVVGTVWVFQLIFSSIWLRYFRFGPFKWLWRSLTCWKKQPMKLLKQINIVSLVVILLLPVVPAGKCYFTNGDVDRKKQSTCYRIQKQTIFDMTCINES